MRRPILISALVLTAAALSGRWAGAQEECLTGGCTGDLPAGLCGLDRPFCVEGGDANPSTCDARGCNFVFNCNEPTVTEPRVEVRRQDGCEFAARLGFEVNVPWNEWARDVSPNGTVDVLWYDRSTVPDVCIGARLGICEYFASDDFSTWVERTGLTCADAPYLFGFYSAQVKNCQQPCPCGTPTGDRCICPATTWTNVENMTFRVTPEQLGCHPGPALNFVPECPERPDGYEPINPFITSGALCRGACGPDCPSQCEMLEALIECEDYGDECQLPEHILCRYDGLLECGTHAGCRIHDDCYDRCASELRPARCRRGCDIDCIREYGPIRCPGWALGRPPYDGHIRFAPGGPTRTGPHDGFCPEP